MQMVLVGSIFTKGSGSATAYNTSSDARLKDVTGEARGLEVINKLNPVAYNWKADGNADEGLIAQEGYGHSAKCCIRFRRRYVPNGLQ